MIDEKALKLYNAGWPASLYSKKIEVGFVRADPRAVAYVIAERHDWLRCPADHRYFFQTYPLKHKHFKSSNCLGQLKKHRDKVRAILNPKGG